MSHYMNVHKQKKQSYFFYNVKATCVCLLRKGDTAAGRMIRKITSSL